MSNNYNYLFKENGNIKCIFDNNKYDVDLEPIIVKEFPEIKQYLDLSIKFNSQIYDFRFYINYYKKLEYELYVFYDILFVNSNLVLGLHKCASDYNYYDISEYKDYILNNIDPLVKEKIINSNDKEDLYIYTNIIEKDKGNCRLMIDREIYKQYNREIYKQFIAKHNHTNNYLYMSRFKKIDEFKFCEFSEEQ